MKFLSAKLEWKVPYKKKKMVGHAATPAIASNPENQLGLPTGASAVLQNTSCNWETVKRVGKEEAGWEDAIFKPVLTPAATSSKQESWDCSWAEWLCAHKWWWFPKPPLSFSSHSKHRVESLSKITNTTLGFPPCLPLGPQILSENKKAEMEARFYNCWLGARTAVDAAKIWAMAWLDGRNTSPHFFILLEVSKCHFLSCKTYKII